MLALGVGIWEHMKNDRMQDACDFLVISKCSIGMPDHRKSAFLQDLLPGVRFCYRIAGM